MPTAIGTALQANPDAVGIVGVDAVSGGRGTAVREAGLSGKVTIVCRDRTLCDARADQEWRNRGFLCTELLCRGIYRKQSGCTIMNGNFKVVEDYLGGHQSHPAEC